MGLEAFIAGAVGILIAIFYAFRKGAQSEKGKQAQKDLKGVQKGIEGAGEAKKKLREGQSPEDIAKGNDGQW